MPRSSGLRINEALALSSGLELKREMSMSLLMLLSGRRIDGALYFDVVIVLSSFSFLLKRHKGIPSRVRRVII